MNIEARICGIPAIIRIYDVVNVPASLSYNEVSDVDYYGYHEYRYEVLDRKGYPALWLENKAFNCGVDISEIISEALDHA